MVQGLETMVRSSTTLVLHLVALCSGFASLVCSERELRVCSQLQVWSDDRWSDDRSHYQGVAMVVELENVVRLRCY